MQVFAQTTERTHVIDIRKETLVSELLEIISQETSVPEDKLSLSYIGSPLVSGPLTDYGITHESNIQVSGRIPGGKVHGSLARAGKVKNVTPKVEKQDKKKAKTGRAKRREQYKRRFQQQVTGRGGRPKGPNSNSAS
ncbi:40S ribosomal protein S30 [Oopsacas minuta]|uniref:40S ribosomal protein S30 n=1 Tax=Oopsacas minuta TaxID=111878 RepID=A0AAV7JD11_9METZ|nr:40S ribosomal protein S30 [Oopsacas minuta]